VNAEFNVWLLIVGLVLGAGLVWLVIMDSRRRESDVDEVERPREAAWLSAVLAEDGFDVPPEAAERLLILHRAYLEAPPPDSVEGERDDTDDLDLVEEPPFGEARAAGQRPPTRTGSASTDPPEAPTSDTPNVASPDRPDTAGAEPTQ
jgi:hypothetical protein